MLGNFGRLVSIRWYKFICWLWYWHTTIKPRYVDHTYHDTTSLMPHMMFELLSRFIEEEADDAVWYHEYATLINGKNIRDEMQELYDWWHKEFKEYDEIEDIIFNELEKHSPLSIFGDYFNPKYRTNEDKIIYECLLTALNKLEIIRENDIKIKMIRLVKITEHLWT